MRAKTPRVLFAAAEVYPMAKTGGLGDVASALPRALRDLGVDVRVIMPSYRGVAAMLPVREDLGMLIGAKQVGLSFGEAPGELPTYLVESAALFDRPGDPYHDAAGDVWPDNAQRFAAFCDAIARLAHTGDRGWTPDVVHVNDWHTALVPSLLRRRRFAAASVLTIHNALYQEPLPDEIRDALALAPAAIAQHEPGVPPTFLATGIRDADRLTTVSPTYARELQTPTFGCGLERLLQARAGVFFGILNGIDVEVWNPATDATLARTFSVEDLEGKAACKLALLRSLDLAGDLHTPVLGCVSRLTWQKGLDVLVSALPQLLAAGIVFVLLGTGDDKLQRAFRSLAAAHPRTVAALIAYDETLAHRIIGGADMIVMPSRLEPCGLNQMYGLHYGTIPIVHRVGGLADTVFDARLAPAPQANGFSFDTLDGPAIVATVQRALETYRNPPSWHALQRTGMRQDLSWPRAARAYLEVYSGARSASATD